MSKRLVVIDDEGQYTILGDHDEPLPILLSIPVEAEVTEVAPTGMRLVTFNLIKVKTRFALYRQIQVPPGSRFNDTFDPAQV